MRCISVGKISKGRQLLESSGLFRAPDLPSIFRDLHPPAFVPSATDMEIVPAPAAFVNPAPLPDLESLTKALGSAVKKATSVDVVDLVGLSAFDFKVGSSVLLESLAGLFQCALINPAPFRSLFGDGWLIPHKKPNDNVKPRPINIASPFSRLLGKTLVYLNRSWLRKAGGGYQFSFGKPNGTSTVVHAISTLLSTKPDWSCLSFDSSNAFNSISRVHLSKCLSACPNVALSAYFNLCYQPGVGYLVHGDNPLYEIPIQRGVKQGDPLGTAFFNLVMASGVEKALVLMASNGHTLGEDFALFAFSDDVFVVAEPWLCVLWRDMLASLLRAVGVEMNVRKTVVVRDLVVLGSPVGSSEFVAEHLLSLGPKIEFIVHRASVLIEFSPDHAYPMLRFSTRVRFSHLARTVLPSLLCSFALTWDYSLTLLYKLLLLSNNAPRDSLRAPQVDALALAAMPCWRGGLGLDSMSNALFPGFVAGATESLADNAYCASLGIFLASVPGYDEAVGVCFDRGATLTRLAADEDTSNPLLPLPVLDVSGRVPSAGSGVKGDFLYDPTVFFPKTGAPHLQRRLNYGMAARRFVESFSSLSAISQTIVEGNACGSATLLLSAFFCAPSVPKGLLFHIRSLVGLGPFPHVLADLPCGAAACKKSGVVAGHFGLHSLSCSTGAYPHRRHNAVRDLVGALVREIDGCSMQSEYFVGTDSDGSRIRADGLFSEPVGSWAGMDVAVISHLAQKNGCVDIDGSGKLEARLAATYARKTLRYTSDKGEGKSLDYGRILPIVMATNGSLHHDLLAFIAKVGSICHPEDRRARVVFEVRWAKNFQSCVVEIFSRFRASLNSKFWDRSGVPVSAA